MRDADIFDPIELVLPWPPSVNHYWLRNRGGGVRVSDAARTYRKEVTLISRRPGRKPIGCPVRVTITAHQPNRIKRDIDNIQKAMLDALSHAGVWRDDALVHSLSIAWGSPIEGGACDVWIGALNRRG